MASDAAPSRRALQSGTTRSLGAWPANWKAIVWYGTPGATGNRPMACKRGLSTRRLPIALSDRPWKFSSLITAGPFSALSSSTCAVCSANGRTRPPKKTPTMLFASRLPRWGVAMKMTRRTYGSGWKNRSWSTAARVAGEARNASGGTLRALSQTCRPESDTTMWARMPPMLCPTMTIR